MELTELKVGDLIAYNGKVAKVDGVDPPFFYLKIGYVRVKVRFYDNGLEPIPLTKEILEKSGWKKDDDDGAYVIKDLIFLSKDGFGGWTVGISEDYVLTIYFVHQLQHILWALEIGDNLKV